MSWIWSALMPHPPILVPEVGCGREAEAQGTLNGLHALMEAVEPLRPDVLLVLSPHQPGAAGALRINTAPALRGSFAPFGAPEVRLDLVSNAEDQDALGSFLTAEGVNLSWRPSPNLSADQGTTVPLYFLNRAWGNLPPTVPASPTGLAPQEALELGRKLAGFDDGRSWALLASGDLSHRLTPDAPAGYAPDEGHAFDDAVVEALRRGTAEPLLALSPEVVDRAGQCGLWSVLVMLGLMEAAAQAKPGAGARAKVLSCEGPFGVGYCCAVWTPTEGGAAREMPPPVRLARETVTRLLEGRDLPENGDEVCSSSLWNAPAACFVSIKTRRGALRGCIGTLSPTHGSLDREIIENAVLASTKDPRFPPMSREELADAVFSVDVLSAPEPVEGPEQLDPKVWGVIVSRGWQRGVLLPDLEGVDTVEQQVEIAARKAGLRGPEGVTLERFSVMRYKEKGQGPVGLE